MSKALRFSGVAVALVFLGFAAHAPQASSTDALQARYQGITHVEVFANSAVHIPQSDLHNHAVVSIYRIDGLAMLEEELNINLPSNEAQAYRYMIEKEAEIKKKYQSRINNAASGLTLAIQYKLNRLPAVVFNQRFVIYGVNDLEQAAMIFQKRRFP